MNQGQGQQYQPPRRTGTYSSQHSQHNDELHMSSGLSHQGQGQGQGQISPRDYSMSSAGAPPHIKLDQPQSPPQMQSYQSAGAIPNVLQPGGLGSRPSAVSSNTAPTLSSMQQHHQQQQDYQTPSKPNTLNLSHNYSRSSPAAPYDGASSYVPYTPTTPGGGGGGAGTTQFMSPTDNKYNPSNPQQRNISNTPLGLADIRPRADSNLSDGLPGTPSYEFANAQARTSSYMAPWASYAFDWCKWQPQGNGAGKVAIGSYLEDGHNFVSTPEPNLYPTRLPRRLDG